ncbi:MAG: alpha/beta hydrolase [Bacteroidia bacterium]|nr:alpha/beta hydrolase [Bacteroidia bacterium]
MRRNLIIFTGLGTPDYGHFLDTYLVIKEEALKRGYQNVQIADWPGHGSHPSEEMLSLTTAVSAAEGYLHEFEACQTPYDLIGTSFGSQVALRVLGNFFPGSLPCLGSITLWGLYPYWRTYQNFRINLENTMNYILETKQTRLHPDYFLHQVPSELLLMNYAHEKPLMMINGELDRHCTPSFHAYLKALFYNPNISFKIVKGAPHMVRNYDRDYLDALFSNTPSQQLTT